uniref:C2H2-type domain-containing protein n=1 Tax=Timema bartmani TaxID=61472 RepID=A0A7R9EPE8_9NEOP|nr:unnamed protein product [Timema bartmani]
MEKEDLRPDNSQLDEIRSNHVNEFVMKVPSIDCTLGGTDNIRGSPTVTVGPDNKVECMLCQCFLEAAEHTTLHMVTHGIGTIVCRCRVCGQQGDLSYFQQTGERFSQKSSLKLHKQSHTGMNPHTCHQCGQKFRFKYSAELQNGSSRYKMTMFHRMDSEGQGNQKERIKSLSYHILATCVEGSLRPFTKYVAIIVLIQRIALTSVSAVVDFSPNQET